MIRKMNVTMKRLNGGGEKKGWRGERREGESDGGGGRVKEKEGGREGGREGRTRACRLPHRSRREESIAVGRGGG